MRAGMGSADEHSRIAQRVGPLARCGRRHTPGSPEHGAQVISNSEITYDVPRIATLFGGDIAHEPAGETGIFGSDRLADLEVAPTGQAPQRAGLGPRSDRVERAPFDGIGEVMHAL